MENNFEIDEHGDIWCSDENIVYGLMYEEASNK